MTSGTTFRPGEISPVMMSIILMKQRTDMKNDGWKKKMTKLERSTSKKNEFD